MHARIYWPIILRITSLFQKMEKASPREQTEPPPKNSNSLNFPEFIFSCMSLKIISNLTNSKYALLLNFKEQFTG